LPIGAELYITDGKGNLYKALIIDNNSKACVLQIVRKIENYDRMSYCLHIAVAPTKNTDRLEWFAEKAVEIGINEITTLICKNSERISSKPDRMERLMISAMKQSLHVDLPVFTADVSFPDFIAAAQKRYSQKFIAYCGALELPTVPLQTVCVAGESVCILIGPEGDFTHDEVCSAINCGFVPVSLGKFRLRTETAAMLACSVVQVINEQSKFTT
jgi:16S rRNA (uracil1498-N3)-methyltransferase